MSISEEHPIIKSNEDPLLHPNEDGHLVGKNPLSLEVNLIKEAGHANIPIGQVIRKKCLDCCNFQAGEVRKCVLTSCPLWPYRMGKNPFISAKHKKTRGGHG